MFSVIIPTMLSNITITRKLLDTLLRDPIVGEIIIINNSGSKLENNKEKIRIIEPGENIYVGPSWNLGISISKFDYFALFNDDLLVCENFLSKVFPLINNTTGIIGADIKHIQTTYNANDFTSLPEEREATLLPVNERTYAFGILMIGPKTSYCKIPEELKVWCGDDLLVKYNKDNSRQNYVVQGPIIKHMESLTSNNPKFDAIKKADLEYYKKMDKDFWYK